MSQDDEVRELERRIETGDLTAWPILDAALARVGRPPRRVWMVNDIGGEYSDRWETVLEPVHATKAGAIKHMEQFVESNPYRGVYVRPEGDPEEFRLEGERGRLFVSWAELVP